MKRTDIGVQKCKKILTESLFYGIIITSRIKFDGGIFYEKNYYYGR